uniref:UPAR/Ly6 domain-containing protein n=1 Tax=Salarias fasciatus TaxID=181472 RepID=A0A672HY17_SALFA
MYQLLLILGVVLLPEGKFYNLYEIISPPPAPKKNTQKNKKNKKKQLTVAVLWIAGNDKISDSSVRGCALPEECIQASLNYGLSRTIWTSRCCSTDLCNDQPAPEASHFNPNGRKCFFCNGVNCTGTLNCFGNEDRCISTTVSSGGTTVELKGCASQEMCSALNIPGLEEVLGQDHECCQGDFCNSAISTSAGLLLSVVPLISLVLFS